MRTSPVAALLALALTVTACGSNEESAGEDSSAPRFAVLSDSPLATSNAASAWGDAVGAAQLASRVYPALYVPGPAGQMVPNSDLAHAEYFAPDGDETGAHVDFTLTEQARFADGEAVTCDDYLLAYTAGQLSETFGSHLPLMEEVSEVECAPRSKKFTVWFTPDAGSRWRYLFGPGTVLPAHVMAKRAGMSVEELNAALHAQDMATLQPVAEAWRDGFSTEPGRFDPDMQVSFGPYQIDRVEDDGSIVLTPNDNYYGDKPAVREVVMLPSSADAAAFVASDELRVAESPTASPSWLDRNAEGKPVDVTSVAGSLTDTLVFSEAGIFAQPWARAAFAACVDTERLAQASSKESGVDVPAVTVRTVRNDDPVAAQMASLSTVPVDNAAASGLSGYTIGVGYLAPNPRYKAMVEQLRAACEPAGITVEDRSGDRVSREQLSADPATGQPEIDVYLGAVDPMREHSAPASSVKNASALRTLEQDLWEELPSIPISAQPRTFITDRAVTGVVPYTGPAGIGWNLDRWSYTPQTATETKEES
ncbi:ABC transporter substrate-binding protein [Corynebacterium guaraldiae]|uniref:ABC transporter substrate-binding protein n=1 Tax=Corynebacterium guaraldiae TaxID=3051103 RepID=UPI001177FF0F|nr:ABC transporter substrate-binding protein [Corynebacterium guaraldiae]TRX41075.1 DNA-binding protein [Corynebacterium guaraldiae]